MSQSEEQRGPSGFTRRSAASSNEFSEIYRLLDPELGEEERVRLTQMLEAEDPQLRQELASSQQLELALAALSPGSRKLCPSPEERFQAAQKSLSRGLQERFDRHLSRCHFCREDLADARAVLQPNLLQIIVNFSRSAFEVLSSEFQSSFSPTPALAVRSSESTRLWTGRLEQGESLLELELSGDHNQGALLSLRTERAGRPLSISALLFQGQQVLEGKTATDGRLSFDALSAGDYELRIREKGGDELDWQLAIQVANWENGDEASQSKG